MSIYQIVSVRKIDKHSASTTTKKIAVQRRKWCSFLDPIYCLYKKKQSALFCYSASDSNLLIRFCLSVGIIALTMLAIIPMRMNRNRTREGESSCFHCCFQLTVMHVTEEIAQTTNVSNVNIEECCASPGKMKQRAINLNNTYNQSK